MVNRKGVFIGAYVPNELKESLRRRGAQNSRTLSQEITRILIDAVHGTGLPTGSVDRRDRPSIPRRREDDPYPRNRKDDLAVKPAADNAKPTAAAAKPTVAKPESRTAKKNAK